MPKILIREQDRSNVSVYGEDNFSVLVPGYVNPSVFKRDQNAEKELESFEVKDGVYRFTKVADFENYIGCYEFKDSQEVPAKPGRFSTPVLRVAPTGAALPTIENYAFNATFNELLDSVTSSEYKLYSYEETSTAKPAGKDYFQIPQEDSTVKTYKIVAIEEVPGTDSFEDKPAEDGKYYTLAKVVKILNKELGVDGVAAQEEVVAKHMGNQIAFELLNLGYTVLYKVMNNDLGINQLDNDDFWDGLKDRSIYSFRYILTGLKGNYATASIMDRICSVASSAGYDEDELGKIEEAEKVGETNGRGDCIALCDINEAKIIEAEPDTDKKLAEAIIASAEDIKKADKYAAIFGPQVIYSSVNKGSSYTYKNSVFPASFHYLACAAHAQKTYREWYAVAGYTRGISTLPIKATTYIIGDRIVNTVAPRTGSADNKSVNLILKERSNYYIWSNRTAEALNINGLKFSHFLNIRQLCTTIKQHIYTACRKYMFDPNSDLLWINFVNTMKPLLETMKADQGISGYKIVKVANEKKALLTANIKIVPIEAVEDFDIKIELNEALTGLQASVEEVAK